jgi:hypothetical protein
MSDYIKLETETIDKLFLELSQVTKAKTARVIHLERLLGLVLKAWEADGIKDVDGHIQLYNRASLHVPLNIK